MTLATAPLAAYPLAYSVRRSRTVTPDVPLSVRQPAALAGGPLAGGLRLQAVAAATARVRAGLNLRVAATGATKGRARIAAPLQRAAHAAAASRIPAAVRGPLRQRVAVVGRPRNPSVISSRIGLHAAAAGRTTNAAAVLALLSQGIELAGTPLNAGVVQSGYTFNAQAIANANLRAIARLTLAQGIQIAGAPLNAAMVLAELLQAASITANIRNSAQATLEFGTGVLITLGAAEAAPSLRAFNYKPYPRTRRMTPDGRLERITGKIIQDPSALLDYELEFLDALGAGEILTAHSVTATQGTVSLVSRDFSRVAAWFTGGTSGTTAALRFSATSSGGRTFVATLRVNIGPDVVSTL